MILYIMINNHICKLHTKKASAGGADDLDMYAGLVQYIDTFITAVDLILSKEYGEVYYINPDETLVNIKPAVFRQVLSENQSVDVQNCLSIFKKLRLIKSDPKVYTSVQWTGHRAERVIAVDYEVFRTIKELKK